MVKRIDRDRIESAVQFLQEAADWFDGFGNYTRARDARRMADGLKEYTDEMAEPQ